MVDKEEFNVVNPPPPPVPLWLPSPDGLLLKSPPDCELELWYERSGADADLPMGSLENSAGSCLEADEEEEEEEEEEDWLEPKKSSDQMPCLCGCCDRSESDRERDERDSSGVATQVANREGVPGMLFIGLCPREGTANEDDDDDDDDEEEEEEEEEEEDEGEGDEEEEDAADDEEVEEDMAEEEGNGDPIVRPTVGPKSKSRPS
jgi:hypothetical protein